MQNRKVLAIAAIVAVVAVGGIGFAAFTSSAYINGSGAAGSFGPLTWTAGTGTAGGPGAVTAACTDSVSSGYVNNPGDTLELGASNLAPGGSCSFTATLTNTGSLPGSIFAGTPTMTGGNDCGDFTYTGAFGGAVIGASGGTMVYTSTLTLSSSASIQDGSCTFSVTVSGSSV